MRKPSGKPKLQNILSIPVQYSVTLCFLEKQRKTEKLSNCHYIYNNQLWRKWNNASISLTFEHLYPAKLSIKDKINKFVDI